MIYVYGVLGLMILAIGIMWMLHGHRRPDRLEYDDESALSGSGLQTLPRDAVESLHRLAWGSGSVPTWRRRCEASLRASQARRARR